MDERINTFGWMIYFYNIGGILFEMIRSTNLQCAALRVVEFSSPPVSTTRSGVVYTAWEEVGNSNYFVWGKYLCWTGTSPNSSVLPALYHPKAINDSIINQPLREVWFHSVYYFLIAFSRSPLSIQEENTYNSVTSCSSIFTKSSNPNRVPTTSLSFFMIICIREPMHLSTSSIKL